MNCKKCGAIIEANDSVCKNCGTKVEEVSTVPAENVTAPVEPSPVPPTDNTTQPVESNNPIPSTPSEVVQEQTVITEVPASVPETSAPAIENNIQSAPVTPSEVPAVPEATQVATPAAVPAQDATAPTEVVPPANTVQVPPTEAATVPLTETGNKVTNNEEKPKNNILKYIIILVIVIILVGFGVFAIIKLTGNKDNPSPTNPTNNNSSAKANNNTYAIKYGKFTLNIPNDLLSEVTDDDVLLLGDSSNNWAVSLVVLDGQYTTIITNKESVKNDLISSGLNIGNIEQKTYGNKEFLIFVTTEGTTAYLISYAQLDTAHIAAIEVYSKNKKIDFSILEKIEPVITNSKYNGVSTNTIGNFDHPKHHDFQSIVPTPE